MEKVLIDTSAVFALLSGTELHRLGIDQKKGTPGRVEGPGAFNSSPLSSRSGSPGLPARGPGDGGENGGDPGHKSDQPKLQQR